MSELADSRVLKALNDYRLSLGDPIDQELRDKALEDFDDNISHVSASEKRAQYRNIRDTITAGDLEQALDDLVRFTNDEFGEIQDGFELGATTAEAGEEKLFFPKAAAHLGQIEKLIKEIKSATEKINDSVDSLEGVFQKNDVNGLINSGKLVKKTTEELLKTFDELKSNLEGADAQDD